MSEFPVTIAPIAPNKNIKEFPIKKAITVVDTAIFFVLENLVKSGVTVPPLIKDPIHKVIAVIKFIGFVGVILYSLPNPPIDWIAINSDKPPSIAIAGTAIALNIVSDFIPK